MQLGETARGLVDLSRAGNAVAAGVLTATGAFVASPSLTHLGTQWLPVVAAVVATLSATGAGNAINDYFDRDIDRINRPDRPIPRGAVSPRGTLAFSAVLFGLAVVGTLLVPRPAQLIAVVNLLALVAYTKLFKGLPGVGNLVVGYLTGSTFLFGGAAVGNISGAVVLFLLAGVATVTREIVKDVEDVAGDREEGLRTLPIAVGERPALWVGVAIMTAAVLASAYPFLAGAFGVAYLLVVIPADLVMLGASVAAFRDPGLGQRRLKHGMYLAAVAFVVGRSAALLGGVA
ncbi:geranylgeranylglycerol-phosphate geranylgeranyltransferase [Salinirubrum litoreum]|uniref:Digeranylgeranylglyceryl phosphate synthase n=1 Tax=Salinirubrum litoreum TaxID=1126234 RepID=A0ABD5RA30_9EURY|nr:geranylgeranylglycerol-phosphate geranylgeranyltransferase [Salinirubrum litoreum]